MPWGKRPPPSLRPEGPRELAERCRRPGERRAAQPRRSNAGPTVSRPFRPHPVTDLSTKGIDLSVSALGSVLPARWAGRLHDAAVVEHHGPSTRVRFCRRALAAGTRRMPGFCPKGAVECSPGLALFASPG